jgi:hypothetical protein
MAFKAGWTAEGPAVSMVRKTSAPSKVIPKGRRGCNRSAMRLKRAKDLPPLPSRDCPVASGISPRGREPPPRGANRAAGGAGGKQRDTRNAAHVPEKESRGFWPLLPPILPNLAVKFTRRGTILKELRFDQT